MSKKRPPSFLDLDLSEFDSTLIFLDVDGTIVPDGTENISPLIREKIRDLASKHSVFFCSNKRGEEERNRQLSKSTGVPFLPSLHRKPSRRVLEGVDVKNKSLIVVGDKFLTDGAFARRIGAQFFQVAHLTSNNDTYITRWVYTLDSCVQKCDVILRLFRVNHWVKNFLIFAPLFFAKDLFDRDLLFSSTSAFFGFSFAASTVYLVNDIVDQESDRRHPTKRFRPIASGDISTFEALIFLTAVLVVLSLGSFFLFSSIFSLVLAVYIFLNVLYSFYLKHVPFVDIFVVSFFYVLRVVAGGAETGIYISNWIVLAVFFASLFVVSGKRRAELAHEFKRRALSRYSRGTLDLVMSIFATLTIVTYVLYTVSGTANRFSFLSTVFVVAGFFRYIVLVRAGAKGTEYPEKLLLVDPLLRVIFLFWVFFMFTIFYLFPLWQHI